MATEDSELDWNLLSEIIDKLEVARISSRLAAETDKDDTQKTASVRSIIPESVREMVLTDDFKELQKQLCLLQTVIHFRQYTVTGIKFTNLGKDEEFEGIDTPWLSSCRVLDDQESLVWDTGFSPVWTPTDEMKKSHVQDIFMANRVRHKLAEFTRHWNSKDKSQFLSDEEFDHGLLLVADQEISFFSMLLTVASVWHHSRDRFDGWLKGNCEAPCLVVHTLENGYSPDSSDVCVNTESFESYFFKKANLRDVCYALGFLADSGNITDRFTRLQTWLSTSGLECKTIRNFAEKSHDSCLFNSKVLESEDGVAVISSLFQICKDWLLACGIADPVDVIRIALSKFFVLGEYLLRKYESASRSYFAIPLHLFFDSSGEPQVGAFALGTLINTEEINDHTITRIRALKQLLRTLASFGVDISVDSYIHKRLAQKKRNLEFAQSLVTLWENEEPTNRHPEKECDVHLGMCLIDAFEKSDGSGKHLESVKSLYHHPIGKSGHRGGVSSINVEVLIAHITYSGYTIKNQSSSNDFVLPCNPGMLFLIHLNRFLESLDFSGELSLDVVEGYAVMEVPLDSSKSRGLIWGLETSDGTNSIRVFRQLRACNPYILQELLPGAINAQVSDRINSWANSIDVRVPRVSGYHYAPLIDYTIKNNVLALKWQQVIG
jgi:hypothetical protein